METSATILRNPVSRLHSLNKQKEYVTPTARDVLCPYFDGTFVKTGEADVTDDFYALCHDSTGDVVCNYKEQLTIDTCLCKRYWKEDPLNMEFLRAEPTPPPAIWQKMNVQFDYERPFKNRTATVELALIREIVTPIDLGDFLHEWKQWYESQAGNWVQTTNAAGRKEILNTINQSGRSFWYNPVHVYSTDYTHEYFVQARADDDDIYGSVFRYNPTDRSFYTFEWDSGGWGINGMAIYRNVYSGGTLSRTLIAHNPTLWGANRSYIHHVSISVIKNRIKVVVRRLNGASYIHIATMEFLDLDPDAPIRGAWGPLTNSQPSTYFWDLNFKENVVIDTSTEPRLRQDIPLSYYMNQSGLHLVSEPMSKFFTQDIIEEAARKSAVDIDAISSKEYWLKGTNVPEGIRFSEYNSVISISESASARIAMTSFNYDGAIATFMDSSVITDRHNLKVVTDTSGIDKMLTRIVINLNDKRLFDTLHIKVNEKTIRYIPNVVYNEYVIEFKEGIQLEIGDRVTVEYLPNPFEMEYYRGSYIDTHDKIFKIEGNVLYWHHIPTYEKEKLE